ncbi:EH signature domain-containing protein [Cupriavidus taiwanensis]|nr:EH signature domain-containing protein [Cupriavidus taiwanensis]
MPDRRPIDALQARLAEAMSEAEVFRALEWGNPRAMTQALRDLRHGLVDVGEVAPSKDQVQASLQRFGATQRVDNFTELKYVCHGITVPVGEERWRVIDNGPLFNRLLTLVDEQQGRPKQYRRCYQGLLHGFFGFDRRGSAAAPAQVNWTTLRGFLDSRLDPVVQGANRRGLCPIWLGTLADHRNLLTDNPCRRYADALTQGNTDELRKVCADLGIANSSWVWDEALMAYVRTVCEGNDRAFHDRLSGVLQLVNGRLDLKLPETLAKRATAMTVVRYARCGERPEHPALRDTCLARIGNPWMQRVAWDAAVGDEPARKMVEGWIKRRLIRDFFEHLAADGTADRRRLEYWLKWEPQISQMWFVLGRDAWRDRSATFQALRKRMESQARELVDSDDGNNAFIMQIGDLIVIEFGKTGNACFVYHAANFKADLDAPRFDTNRELKQRENRERLIHNGAWEWKFDEALKAMLRSAPPAPPRQAGLGTGLGTSPAPSLSDADFRAICRMCRDYRVEWEDNRPKGGALWVLITEPKRLPRLSVKLRSLGFEYKAGRGFWIKE